MASKTRVLRIIARLNIGGPAIHTVLLSSGLDAERFETRLVTGTVGESEGDMSWLAEQHGVKPVILPSLGREIDLPSDLRALRALRQQMRDFRPHIVHTHTAKAGALGRVAARFYNAHRPRGAPRTRVVHTYHGHVLYGYFGPMKNAMFKRIERRLAGYSDRLVALSPELRRELAFDLKIGHPNQYVVIPLGFDLSALAAVEDRRNTFRRELGVADDTVLVTIVGRLTAIKNHDMLLRAAHRLQRRSRTRVEFAVVGNGELRSELEETAVDLGLAHLFHFAGWRTDMPDVYADSDIVVLTSKNEGTPVTLIEAMAAGRPVVATDVGGVKDVIDDGKTGILVAPHREDRLAIALGQLADLPEERARLAQAAREGALKQYDKKRLFEDVEKLYRELVPDPG